MKKGKHERFSPSLLLYSFIGFDRVSDEIVPWRNTEYITTTICCFWSAHLFSFVLFILPWCWPCVNRQNYSSYQRDQWKLPRNALTKHENVASFCYYHSTEVQNMENKANSPIEIFQSNKKENSQIELDWCDSPNSTVTYYSIQLRSWHKNSWIKIIWSLLDLISYK